MATRPHAEFRGGCFFTAVYADVRVFTEKLHTSVKITPKQLAFLVLAKDTFQNRCNNINYILNLPRPVEIFPQTLDHVECRAPDENKCP